MEYCSHVLFLVILQTLLILFSQKLGYNNPLHHRILHLGMAHIHIHPPLASYRPSFLLLPFLIFLTETSFCFSRIQCLTHPQNFLGTSLLATFHITPISYTAYPLHKLRDSTAMTVPISISFCSPIFCRPLLV